MGMYVTLFIMNMVLKLLNAKAQFCLSMFEKFNKGERI